MKQLIKTILKEESLKQDLKQSVKDYGWESTANLIGGSKDLEKIAFNNDPMEFLNMYNDLDIVQSKYKPNWTLFRYEKGKNMGVYDRKTGNVIINYNDIWLVLEDGFNLKEKVIKELTRRWLGEVYNLKGITTWGLQSLSHLMLNE